jgi:hypothetical protein
MRRTSTRAALVALPFVFLSPFANAVDAGDGVRRMGEGTVDAVTSPGRIVDGVSDETSQRGPVAGTVTGTAKGSVKAAGQATKGGAKIATGAAETGAGIVKKVLEPLGGSE